MIVPDSILKTVVYIGPEYQGRFSPNGTGFHIQYPADGENKWYQFIVSAAHVIDGIAGDYFSVRLNRKDGGGAEAIKFHKEVCNFDRDLDLVIFNVSFGPDVYDTDPFPVDAAYRQRFFQRFGKVSLGEEVATVGLYTSHFGHHRNTPVIRIGNISALPSEPIWSKVGKSMPAYLIEVRTLAGLSGSPVILNKFPVLQKDGQIQFLKATELTPIGILIGQHFTSATGDKILTPKYQGEEKTEKDEEPNSQLSTGLAVVVPFERVFEWFDRHDIKEAIEEANKRYREQTGFEPLSAASSEANPHHREDFNRLLDATARKPKQDD